VGAALSFVRHVLVVAAVLGTACAPTRPPAVPGEATPAPSTTGSPAVSWREWGAPAFEEARAARRPVVVLLSRRGLARDRELVAAAIDGDQAPAVRWAASGAILVRADADEVPELADFAELAATVFHRERGYPLALLMTPEGVPLGVAADAGFPDELDGLLAEHAALPSLRVADAPSLQSIRRAQQPMKSTRPPTREAAVRRAQGLAAGRTEGLSRAGLLLLIEGHDVLHQAALGAAASRALAARGRRSETPRLESAAWDVWGNARLGESAVASALAASSLSALAEAGGLFHAAQDDPRVFTAANGIMIAGLAAAGAVEPATKTAEALLRRVGGARALRRGFDGDRDLGPARLDDYAGLGLGLVALHEATSDTRWLREAEAIADAAVAGLWDNAAGGFYLHAEPIAPLPVRIRSGFDSERPSANALMALLLDDLGQRLARPQLRDLARRTVEAFAGELERSAFGLDGLHAAALRVLPAAARPTPAATAAAPLPFRLVRGAVTIEARLTRPSLRAGERVQIHVEVRTTEGWRVTPHRTEDRGAVPLSAALLDPELGAGPAVYPTTSAQVLTALVPLRVPAGTSAGRREARVAVRFEACTAAGACQAPERVTLGVSLTIAP
jgi:hypothetical protein